MRSILLCAVIGVIATGLIILIYSTEPTAKRINAVKETPMLVQVIEVEKGAYRPQITAMGSVRPEKEIDLSPLVGGQIIAVSDSFSPGGYVRKGELLLQIDPADYEATVLERESALHQAQAELEMELGKQDVARQDYALMQQDLASINKSLVLREPQLNAAKARIEAAESALKRARLDLDRTRIVAPFDAHILSREVNLGSLVSPGSTLAKLVGVESYWVEAMVPLSTLNWIDFPAEVKGHGSPAQIRNRSVWADGISRSGTTDRLVGALESRTRLARILISIPDPLALDAQSEGSPKLIVGSYVEASIEGKVIENVVRLDRDYLRKDDTTWVMEDGLLRIRSLDIVFRDQEYAYVREGLSQGDKIVVTNLSTVRDGASLRLQEESQ